MKILRFDVGDILTTKKKHPCGSDRMKVMRVGSDIRVICLGCGRDMTLERVRLEKAVRKINGEIPPA